MGVVLPDPTTRFGITFIFTTSPSAKLCFVVFAAETLVDTVVTILSISPVTCGFWDSKKYNDDYLKSSIVMMYDYSFNNLRPSNIKSVYY